jgi:flagellin-like protein
MKFGKKRSGISEFIAALIMIAITLVAGTAAFGWILSQAGTSEQSYGNSVNVGVNFLNERFTLVSQSFYGLSNATCPASPYPGNPGECSLAYFWLFNTGKVDFTLFSIQIKSLVTPPDGNNLNIIFNETGFTVISPPLAACVNQDNGDGFTNAVNGFIPKSILPQGHLSPGPYRISMPTCGGTHLYLFDGTTYTVSLTGLYGNIVTESITPNG